MYTILICDDDEDIVSALKIFLNADGYETVEAYNGMQAIEAVKNNEIHLILMDVMMPGISGVETMIKIRNMGFNVPIILLTAKSEDSDKILGLNCGADDYITKPYNTVEVLARVRSQLRRYTQLGGGSLQKTDEESCLTIGNIVLDNKTKTVKIEDEEIKLTPTEFEILRLFMEHPEEVFSLAQIYKRVWNDEALGAESTVAVHIRHLREKIEIDPADPKYIKVVWGQGYKMKKG